MTYSIKAPTNHLLTDPTHMWIDFFNYNEKPNKLYFGEEMPSFESFFKSNPFKSRE